MIELKDKIKLIDKICDLHPAFGTEKGWSTYIGGMADTGYWFFRKMIDIPYEELEGFYISHLKYQEKCRKQAEEYKIKIEEHKKKYPEMHVPIEVDMGNGKKYFTTKYFQEQMDKSLKEFEYKILYSKYKYNSDEQPKNE